MNVWDNMNNIPTYAEFLIKSEKILTGTDIICTDKDGKLNYFKILIDVCNALLRGEKNNYIINLPPRLGKSRYLCAYLIAYTFGITPRAEFIYTSYGEDVTKNHIREVMAIMTSKYYKSIFGSIMEEENKSWKLIKTKAGGVLKASHLGGVFTGFGAGLKQKEGFTGCLILDDPHEAISAFRPKVLEQAFTKFTTSIISRLNRDDTPIIVIGQRVSDLDLHALLLEKYAYKNWIHITLPALLEDNTSIFPETYSVESLKNLEAEDPITFWSQYQQKPIALIGCIFKLEYFKYYDDLNPSDIIECDKDCYTIGIDPNGHSTTSEDQTAIILVKAFFLKNKTEMPCIVIERIYAQKIETVNDIAIRLRNFATPYLDKLRGIFIEVHTNGNAILELVRDNPEFDIEDHKLIRTMRRKEKRAFMREASSFIAGGKVYLHRGNPMNDAMFKECKNIKIDTDCKDDIMDCLSEIITQIYSKKTISFYPKKTHTTLNVKTKKSTRYNML